MRGKFRSRVIVAAIALAGPGLAITACGGSDDDSSTATAAATQTSAAGGKTLKVAADPSAQPYQFYASGTKNWQGINVDIAEALSKEMGDKLEFTETSFDSIIPGLQAGRYDLALTGHLDTAEREKVVDFVDYLKVKNNFLLRGDETRTVSGWSDLCGWKVAVGKGTYDAEVATTQSAQCKKDGKPELDVKVYPNTTSELLALDSKNADVVPGDSAMNAYLIRNRPDDYKLEGSYDSTGLMGLAVPKGNAEDFEALTKAMEAIRANGELEKVLAKWGITDRLPAKITTNTPAP